MKHKRWWAKKIFFEATTLLVLSLLLLFGCVTVMAERGRGSICIGSGAPNDVSYFPYRFICGSDANAFPAAAGINANIPGSTDPSDPKDIQDGTLLSFTGGYSIPSGTQGTGIPRYKDINGNIITPTGPDREILVWATIDANNALVGNTITTAQSGTPYISITNSNGGTAGRVAQCPGNYSGPEIPPGSNNYTRGMYAVVYNHRDKQASGSSGFNQSPVAWDGTIGKEDCGHEGKMIYWPQASEGKSYSMNVDLPSNVSGTICVRFNVSVRFSSGEPYFHPDNAFYSDADNDHNSVASHVIQQSAPQCYRANVLPSPPPPTSDCDRYQRPNLQPPSQGATIWRFTQFGIDEPHVMPGGPSIGTVRTAAQIYWETFSSPADHQQTLNSWQSVSSGKIVYTNVGGVPGTFRFTYGEPTGPDRLLYIERWTQIGPSQWRYEEGGESSHNTTTNTRNCYSATCQIKVDPYLVANPNSIVAGQPIPLVITLQNSGSRPLITPISTGSFGVTFDGSLPGVANPILNVPYKLNPAWTNAPPYTFSDSITPTAPNIPGNFTISGYPEYFGKFQLYGQRRQVVNGPQTGQTWGLRCNPTTISIKVPFNLRPHASLTKPGSDENPGTLTYSTSIENQPNPGITVSAPQTSVFQRSPGTNLVPGSPNNTTGPFSPGNPPSNTTLSGLYNIPTLVAGDEYCARVTLTGYNTGYIAAGGVVVDQQLIHDPGQGLYTSDERCFTVKNWPYFKVQKTSIEAGGDFSATNPTCNSGGTLASWNNNNGGYPHGAAGSGTNFTALARGTNIGVASAVDTTTPIQSPLGLSFANTGVPLNAATANSPVYGGNYGGQNCLTDFTAPSTASADVEEYSANTPVAGRIINAGEDKAVYVTGDVYIENNITFGGSTNWSLTGVNKVPSFILKASGNIYVAPGVTQLDGVYLAGGTFYSCGLPSYAPVAKDNLFSSCKNQLTVVGMVIAKKINFMRTYGSLRDGGVGAAATNSCSNAGTRVPNGHLNNPSAGLGGNALTCAAEVFRFSPEAYLGEDVRTQPQNNGAIKYDAITGLPPIL